MHATNVEDPGIETAYADGSHAFLIIHVHVTQTIRSLSRTSSSTLSALYALYIAYTLQLKRCTLLRKR